MRKKKVESDCWGKRKIMRCSRYGNEGRMHVILNGEPLLLLLLLLLKKIGNARLGEGDCHPISPKTPAPHYQPIEEKKRKGK